MKTIAFLSQKGGSGKTTLAVHIAVAAQEAGERVVIVDTDPQRSASIWAETRGKTKPAVVRVAVAKIADLLRSAAADRMTVAVIDTAPHATPEASMIARVSDFVLMPCRPSAFDLAAAQSAFRIVKAAKARAAFVLSACPQRAPEIAEARTALAEYGVLVAPCEVHERRAFARAVSTGEAVTEFESQGKSSSEIRALWAWLKGVL